MLELFLVEVKWDAASHLRPLCVKLNKKNKLIRTESQQGIIFIFHIFLIDFIVNKICQEEKILSQINKCFGPWSLSSACSIIQYRYAIVFNLSTYLSFNQIHN